GRRADVCRIRSGGSRYRGSRHIAREKSRRIHAARFTNWCVSFGGGWSARKNSAGFAAGRDERSARGGDAFFEKGDRGGGDSGLGFGGACAARGFVGFDRRYR